MPEVGFVVVALACAAIVAVGVGAFLLFRRRKQPAAKRAGKASTRRKNPKAKASRRARGGPAKGDGKPPAARIPKELLAALRRIEIFTARLATEQLVGSYTSSFKGQGLAFREVRPYQPGDDVRTIDWNVSARMNEPFVKVFVEEREMTVLLCVDLSESLLFGTRRSSKARLASEIAALLAFSAIRNGDRVGLIVGTHDVEKIVPPKKGEKHVMRVVREILGFEPEWREELHPEGAATRLGAATDLQAILESLVRVSKRRSIAFVISDFLAQGYERTLALAAAKHDVIPIVLTDPRDREIPDMGLVTFEDLESGETVLCDTADPRVRAHHKHATTALLAAQRQLSSRLGLDVVEISTGGSYVEPIRDLFARRAKRAHGR
jgi:uncharacterized protein (DUF58 family)